MSETFIIRGDVQRQALKRLIDTCPDGYVLTVAEPKRTNDQNAKWHAMVTDVMRAEPDGRVYPMHVWKPLLMADAGFKPRFELALDGAGVVPIGYKSSGLRKAEFTDLIEATYAYGARFNVRWSDPETRMAERRAAA